jgi:hypothetical protein
VRERSIGPAAVGVALDSALEAGTPGGDALGVIAVVVRIVAGD